MVSRESGILKVLDFGVAGRVEVGGPAGGMLMGTPNYMSPEQVVGQAADQRERRLLGGPRPVRAGRLPSGVSRRHTAGHPAQGAARVARAPQLDRPGSRPVTEAIVNRAIEKAPAARYADLECDAMRICHSCTSGCSSPNRQARIPIAARRRPAAAAARSRSGGRAGFLSPASEPPPARPLEPGEPRSTRRSRRRNGKRMKADMRRPSAGWRPSTAPGRCAGRAGALSRERAAESRRRSRRGPRQRRSAGRVAPQSCGRRPRRAEKRTLGRRPGAAPGARAAAAALGGRRPEDTATPAPGDGVSHDDEVNRYLAQAQQRLEAGDPEGAGKLIDSVLRCPSGRRQAGPRREGRTTGRRLTSDERAHRHRSLSGSRAARPGRHGDAVPRARSGHRSTRRAEGAARGQPRRPGALRARSAVRRTPRSTRTSSRSTTSASTRASRSSRWSTSRATRSTRSSARRAPLDCGAGSRCMIDVCAGLGLRAQAWASSIAT